MRQLQLAEAKRAERALGERLAERGAAREELRAQLEREGEAAAKLRLQQADFEWRQKYQARGD